MRRPVAIGVGATVLFLTLLPNCSTETDSTGGACGDYVDALIGFSQRCNGTSGLGAFQKSRDRYLIVCTNALNAPGAVNLAPQLNTCTARLNAISCDERADCATDFKGTLPDGAACLEGYQCTGGACDGRDDQCGHCISLAAVGQPCSDTQKCVDDAECASSGNGESKCVAVIHAKAGESCRSSGTQQVRCDPGLYCDYADIMNAVCKAKSAAGAPCKSKSECADNLACNDQVCGPGSPVGGPCQNFQGCATGLVCGTDNKCAQPTYVATAGQPCDLVTQCAKGRCKGFSIGTTGGKQGACEDPIPDGSPCQKESSSSNGDDPPRCDTFAECVNGVCTVPNPATCQ